MRETLLPLAAFRKSGTGVEWRNVSNTQDMVAFSTLTAPHPQPFSPDDRGEAGMNKFVTADACYCRPTGSSIPSMVYSNLGRPA